jgi:hypothetical protein
MQYFCDYPSAEGGSSISNAEQADDLAQIKEGWNEYRVYHQP